MFSSFKLLNSSKIKLPEELPPMSAGLVGYLGFDNIELIENIPSKNPSKLNLPDGLFMRPTIMIIFDSVEHTMTIVTPIYTKKNYKINYKNLYKRACFRIKTIINLLKQPMENKELIIKKKPNINIGNLKTYKGIQPIVNVRGTITVQ